MRIDLAVSPATAARAVALMIAFAASLLLGTATAVQVPLGDGPHRATSVRAIAPSPQADPLPSSRIDPAVAQGVGTSHAVTG